MKVLRIVPNIETQDITKADSFYEDVLGLTQLMNHGWIATYGTEGQSQIQVSFAIQGGSDTPTPDLSIEVDDLDEAFKQMKNAGFQIEYGPVVEPWGVKRFYVRDPYGKLINILCHV
ncbi:VOC family protein [Pseudalkalibacillus berkeleyi]|uniref:VOC family protein n=1 Tax=Pseudalkalibacillus berkeleyi TaxID=1069813 RepID=A0ABS9GUQ4_9BACL|nr:VOC family protein [Pseudalkalibacillus berkeleyi]MCF6136573.1 VOC family protein [Pseudalkalibacillus berkeleyi]